MSIARHVAVVGAATLASRVLGFVRDVAIAGLFGTGMRADAFVVAFQFSNLVRRLLTEGALNSAFVPLYLRRRDEGGERAAARLCRAGHRQRDAGSARRWPWCWPSPCLC